MDRNDCPPWAESACMAVLAGCGAPHGPRNGAYKTGAHTKAAVALRKLVAELVRRALDIATSL